MKNRALVLFVWIVSLIACCIEVDISAPSFPAISDYFQTTDGMVQLTIALNFLGFFVASIVYGPWSDAKGRRPVMLIGNAVMLIGAIGCVFAQSMEMLLISRLIQGLGAATSAVLVTAMIFDVYQGEKAATYIGIMNACLTSLMAIAPVLGSFILEWYGWRGNYSIVAWVTLMAWVLTLFYLPETKKDLRPIPFKQINKDFGILLKDGRFLSASMAPSLMYTMYLVFVSCSPFLYMETYGVSLKAYAVHQAVIVAAFAGTSIYVGKFIEKFGNRTIMRAGLICSTFGALALLGLGFSTSLQSAYLVTAMMSLLCLGCAFGYTVIFSDSLEIYPDLKGTASSVIMAMRALVCALVVGVISYVYDGRLLDVTLVIGLIMGLILCFAYIFYRNKGAVPAKMSSQLDA